MSFANSSGLKVILFPTSLPVTTSLKIIQFPSLSMVVTSLQSNSIPFLSGYHKKKLKKSNQIDFYDCFICSNFQNLKCSGPQDSKCSRFHILKYPSSHLLIKYPGSQFLQISHISKFFNLLQKSQVSILR